jgi:hypothetical protein
LRADAALADAARVADEVDRLLRAPVQAFASVLPYVQYGIPLGGPAMASRAPPQLCQPPPPSRGYAVGVAAVVPDFEMEEVPDEVDSE